MQGCVWRERAMICSCLAADGERSKWEEADTGLVADNDPCWDWPGPSKVLVNGQLFIPASGRLTGEA